MIRKMFVALTLSDDTLDELAELQDQLRFFYDGVKYVPKQNMHITLRYLGEQSTNLLHVFHNRIAEHCSRLPTSLTMSATGLEHLINAKCLVLSVWGSPVIIGSLRELAHVWNDFRDSDYQTWYPHITLVKDVLSVSPSTPKKASHLPIDIKGMAILSSNGQGGYDILCEELINGQH